ncbi:MAG TPA: hypothetical protein PK854_12135, partial [Oscillospiraceae bacterium]|nr:hypothetical protein [Oscillospiraceae bacterium]
MKKSKVLLEQQPLAMGPLTDLREVLNRALLLYGDRTVLRESQNGEIAQYSCKNIVDDVNALG